jgi:hypothetical protein
VETSLDRSGGQEQRITTVEENRLSAIEAQSDLTRKLFDERRNEMGSLTYNSLTEPDTKWTQRAHR